jgi:hypothetical protein
VLAQEHHLLGWLTGLPEVLNHEQVDTLARLLDRELPPRQGANRRASLAATSEPARQARPMGKSRSSAQRRRAEAGRDLRRGMIKLAVAAAFVVTLPTTLPVLQDYVLQPLAERMAGSIADSVTPPAPGLASPQPAAPPR